MLANEATLHPDRLQENLGKIRQLKTDFDTRREFWKTSTLPATLKQRLQDDVIRTGDTFWDNLFKTFVTAAGERDQAAMRASLDGLMADFHDHDGEVRKFATLSNEFLANAQASAEHDGWWLGNLASVGSGVSVLLWQLTGLVSVMPFICSTTRFITSVGQGEPATKPCGVRMQPSIVRD
eukprot:gene46063-62391_t